MKHKLKHEPIPPDFEVQPLKKGEKAENKATCGHCGLSWDDDKVTSMTPVPAGRCPFECFHISDVPHRFEGAVSSCVHRVDFRYYGFNSELTPELREQLTEAAQERADEMIPQGYRSGELCFVAVTEEEIRGWWEIDFD